MRQLKPIKTLVLYDIRYYRQDGSDDEFNSVVELIKVQSVSQTQKFGIIIFYVKAILLTHSGVYIVNSR